MQTEVELKPIEISVSFVISDNYSQHLAVVFASILKAAGPNETFVFHVLTSHICEENQARLTLFEEMDDRCKVVIHLIDNVAFQSFPLPIEHVSIEMYYRYLLPELLKDEARTIYMDVDILVHQSLRDLWMTQLSEGQLLAGVPDMKTYDALNEHQRVLGMLPSSKYFNSGVLLMELDGLRKIQFAKMCMENTKRYADVITWPDQDVINLTMEGHIRELPQRFNYMSEKRIRKDVEFVVEHFVNFSRKPWCCLWKNTTWIPYLKFLLQTPYRDKAFPFVWSHLKGFFYFTYTKKSVKRVLICGILVYRAQKK